MQTSGTFPALNQSLTGTRRKRNPAVGSNPVGSRLGTPAVNRSALSAPAQTRALAGPVAPPPIRHQLVTPQTPQQQNPLGSLGANPKMGALVGRALNIPRKKQAF